MTYAEYCYEMTGYKPFTTYYSDLSIAEPFGKDAIVDTVRRAIKHKINNDYIIELCIVLNHKSWIWYDRDENSPFVKIYSDLYYMVRDWCFDNLKGADLQKFIRLTD
jgi:hypothetical protein